MKSLPEQSWGSVASAIEGKQFVRQNLSCAADLLGREQVIFVFKSQFAH